MSTDMDCVEVPGPPFVMAMIWSNTIEEVLHTEHHIMMVKNGCR